MTAERDDLAYDAAADWFTRLNEARADAALRRDFRDWIEQDPRHAEAFAKVSSLWEAVGHHAAEPEMVTLRQAALADARNTARNRWQLAQRIPNWWRPAIAACLAVVAIGAGTYYLMQPTREVYTTQLAERRVVTLADNSRVDVDANSQIAVEFTKKTRLIHLTHGQAYFQVEKNKARPFIVEANGRRVIATGTAFDVETLGKGVRVTLTEGHVTVRSASDPSTVLAKLDPGDQLVDEGDAPPRIARLANVLKATSWRQGKLMFDDEPLPYVLAEMNRYSQIKVAAGDAQVAKLRVSGVFNAGDVTSLIDALKAYYPVEAVAGESNQVSLFHNERKTSPSP
ncbi:MAG TPA: FecR domain-containing protein [Rhizomicrobium sp.]|nr:FecR domain-containing protein [Rhizomicrobium sp.]